MFHHLTLDMTLVN